MPGAFLFQIVGNIKKQSPAEAAEMKIDDIVARIDDDECKSIDRFKEDISGKSSFTLTVARCDGVTVEDIRLNESRLYHAHTYVYTRPQPTLALPLCFGLHPPLILFPPSHTHAHLEIFTAKCAMTSRLK